ncbi:uncharacterized protein LOC130443409 [Diorhabda sublineata]|uniref:uncharacterized protein LOC130443409 n=1 Tax=Diorhabda sublineata TaxID=1163346 RepID=UPI0024E0F7BF|nr:uncharacterized protein LOC130443409 [Diorhabda sublineata]
MAYFIGPDISDSDISDDDYVSYENIPENTTFKQVSRELTEKEKQHQLNTSMYNAICNNNVEDVRKFINNGFDVNTYLQNDWTPLFLAVSFGSAKITEELLMSLADVHLKRDSCTTLMMACNCPKETSPCTETLKVIRLLVNHGVDVKAVNKTRMTALMFAANVGNLPAVQFLLPLSNKDAEDNQKWTALFWGVQGNAVDVVKYLLEQNLEYTKPDIRNNTPLDIAKNNDFKNIIELFPQEEDEYILCPINPNVLSFDEMFTDLSTAQPDFFLDTYNMLWGMRSECLIKHLIDKKLTLKTVLSITEEELEELGVKMPFQRYRILAGLYKFHKHPFHPKSIPVVPLTETYSNNDTAIQILSAIKQIITMEAGLHFIMKHCSTEDISIEQRASIKKNIKNIRNILTKCNIISKKICEKTKNLDKQREPVDLVNKDSCRPLIPWRKILFSVSVVTLILVIQLKKCDS